MFSFFLGKCMGLLGTQEVYAHLQKTLTDCFPCGCAAVHCHRAFLSLASQSALDTFRVCVCSYSSACHGFSFLHLIKYLSPVLEPPRPPHSSGWRRPARGSHSHQHVAHGEETLLCPSLSPDPITCSAPQTCPHRHTQKCTHRQMHRHTQAASLDCILPGGREGQDLC